MKEEPDETQNSVLHWMKFPQRRWENINKYFIFDILWSCMQLLDPLTVLCLMTEYQALSIYIQEFLTFR
jgi:hypothetical protein